MFFSRHNSPILFPTSSAAPCMTRGQHLQLGTPAAKRPHRNFCNILEGNLNQCLHAMQSSKEFHPALPCPLQAFH